MRENLELTIFWKLWNSFGVLEYFAVEVSFQENALNV
jgi:hypothetical protein